MGKPELLKICKLMHIDVQKSLEDVTVANLQDLIERVERGDVVNVFFLPSNPGSVPVNSDGPEADSEHGSVEALSNHGSAVTTPVTPQILGLTMDQFNQLLMTAKGSMGADNQKLKGDLRDNCEKALRHTDLGGRILSEKVKPVHAGNSLLDIYLLFESIVAALTKLSIAGTVTVFHFVEGLFPAASFNETVWSAIDCMLDVLVHKSLIRPGKPQQSILYLRDMVQLGLRSRQMQLMHQLWERAYYSDPVFSVMFWDEAEIVGKGLEFSADELYLVGRLKDCSVEALKYIDQSVANGHDISSNLIQLAKTIHPLMSPKSSGNNNLQELKTQVAQLKAKLKQVDNPVPRLQALQPGQSKCSKDICDFAHGNAPCPFETTLCRRCMLPFGPDHKSYAYCNNAFASSIEIQGVVYERVKHTQKDNRKGEGKVSPQVVREPNNYNRPSPQKTPVTSINALRNIHDLHNTKCKAMHPCASHSHHLREPSPSTSTAIHIHSIPAMQSVVASAHQYRHGRTSYSSVVRIPTPLTHSVKVCPGNPLACVPIHNSTPKTIPSENVEPRKPSNSNDVINVMNMMLDTVTTNNALLSHESYQHKPSIETSRLVSEQNTTPCEVSSNVFVKEAITDMITQVIQREQLYKDIRQTEPQGFKRGINQDLEMDLNPEEIGAAHVALLQSPQAFRNMWHNPVLPPQSIEYRNWQAASSPVISKGVVKFYAQSRGRSHSSKADIPWGFIKPLNGNPDSRDVHFTLFALQNVDERAIKKGLVVEYTVLPGTNTAASVDMVQYTPQHRRRGIADSGAHISATSCREALANYRTLTSPIPVGTAASGNLILLCGIGDLHVSVAGKLQVFRNVFYAPDCASTLISVRMMTKFGGWTLYADDKVCKLFRKGTGEEILLDENFSFDYNVHATQATTASVPMSPDELASVPGMAFARAYDSDVEVINVLTAKYDALKPICDEKQTLVAYYKAGIYEFQPLEARDETSLCKWHRRLGHQSMNQVKKFALLHGIHLSGNLDSHKCETCALSKLTQCLSREARPRSANFLDRVYADTIGPITPISYDGFQYATVFTDCATRAPYVYFQGSKSADDTQRSLNRFCIDVGGIPKVLHVDGGSEFQGICQSWCTEKGIKIHMSPPYAHYLNGVVERKIRVLKEMTRALLCYSQLPHTFWSEAMQTAQYILYRSGTTALPEWTSPFQMIHGQQPPMEHLRIFGSKVIYHRPPEILARRKESSFRNHGREGIILGYGLNYPTGTYKILDTETLAVVHSNQVQVFEEQNVTHTQAFAYFSDENQEHTEFEIDETYAPEDLEDDTSDENDEGYRTDPYPKRRRAPVQRYDPVKEAQRPQWKSLRYLTPVSSLFLLDGTFNATGIEVQLPRSDREALNDPVFGPMWRAAKEKELEQFKRFKVYTEVDRDDVPVGMQILPTHFIRTIKSDGRFKYRLVVAGNHQVGDTFYSPTAAFTTLRLVVAECTFRGYRLRQADVSAAYLQSPIEDEIYVEQPPDPEVPRHERRKKVWRLHKAVYGLRKSPRYWFDTVRSAMIKFGLQQSPTDPCLFIAENLIVGLWVDDFIYGGTAEAIDSFESFLTSTFACEAPSPAHHFCGITVNQSINSNGQLVTSLSQADYIERILHHFQVPEVHVHTPLSDYLGPATTPTSHEPPPFRELLGALMFIMIATRPDVAFAVHHLSRFGQCYNETHYAAAVHLAQYLHSTKDRGLSFVQQSTPALLAYSDANWAGCPYTRKSTSGRVILFGGTPVSWASQLQRPVSTSSCESELYALTDTVKETMYLRLILEDMGRSTSVSTPVYCDNEAAVQICSGFDRNLKRVRHAREIRRFLDIRAKYIQSVKREVTVSHCPAKHMLADLFTKPLGPKKVSAWCEQVMCALFPWWAHPTAGF